MKQPYDELPSVEELPDGVSLDNKSLKYRSKIFLYDEIKSIRIFSQYQKFTLNFIPMPSTVLSVLQIFHKNKSKIKITLLFQRFGFRRTKKELQFEKIYQFSKFLEYKTFSQRSEYYNVTETSKILFEYIEHGIFNNKYQIFKDGLIKKNNRDFSSFYSNEFEVKRSYKKLHFIRKSGLFKRKTIDLSIDEDIFLTKIEIYFNIEIPFENFE